MNWKFEDGLFGFIALFAGGVGYSNFDLLQISWGELGTEALKYLWTLFVAASSAGIGILVKRKVERYLDKKNKNKPPTS